LPERPRVAVAANRKSARAIAPVPRCSDCGIATPIKRKIWIRPADK
jgi:hypothetical protein